MKLVVLYGPPAVGKLTVAREVSRLTGLKLFHNHLSWNLVTSVFEWRSEAFNRALLKIRQLMFREAAQADIDLLFTFVYSASRADVAQSYFAAVEDHGGTVCLVRLIAPREVLEQHVVDGSRREVGKMATVEELHRYFEKVTDVDHPIPGRQSLELDTAVLGPEEAARAVVAHYQLG
jgi:chloramphenicol 3-O-phosphotransferase